MMLWRLISLPYARKHLLRWLLTTAGIVLGVGVFVGMHTANRSVLAAFQETIDRIAGSTQLQVTAGEPGFDEDVLEKVQNIPEVRAAAPVIEATVSTASGNLLILGVDMLGDRSLRTYDLENTDASIDDPLVFLAQADSLLVTKTFAEKNGLHVNSRLPMRTMHGDLTFTVRGIMKPGGLASAFGGDLAIMDIYAAQKFLGRGRKFDHVDLALTDGTTLNQGIAKLRAALGPGYEIAPPSSRGEQFEQTSRIYSLASDITSVFALFIGMFIIYNTFAIAVTQRRTEIGILRALGATRRQIRVLFLGESAIAGLCGSILGVLFGIVLASAMAGYIGGILTEVYGVAQRADAIAIDPWLIGAALAMGVATSIIAAIIPSRAAAAVDPVKALQKGRSEAVGERENRIRHWAATTCAAASIVALLLSHNAIIFYAGFVLTVVTAVLLAPALTLWLARLLRPLLQWARPVEGTLAADSLIQGPKRTSGTVAALMLSLALVISLGGLARSSYESISDWMRIALNPDLFVTTAQSVTARTFVFPASLGEGLRRVPGVAEVQLVRSVRVNVRGAPVMLIALDVRSMKRRAKLPAVEGNSADMYRHVSPHRERRRSDRVRELRSSAWREARRSSRYSRTVRHASSAHRRNRPRLLGPARQPSDFARPLSACLARRHGECVPAVPGAWCERSGCPAAHYRQVRKNTAPLRTHQRRRAPIRPALDRSMVRTHVCADRGRRAGGRARGGERADGVDYRSAARARCAAGCGRAAATDSSHGVDGGAFHRSDWSGAWLAVGCHHSVLRSRHRAA
jgi:putative ABC transport system permease protein